MKFLVKMFYEVKDAHPQHFSSFNVHNGVNLAKTQNRQQFTSIFTRGHHFLCLISLHYFTVSHDFASTLALGFFFTRKIILMRENKKVFLGTHCFSANSLTIKIVCARIDLMLSLKLTTSHTAHDIN
jgi:hypothetical protein